ncbi:GNAT family N-acetyltransferase [Pelagibius litoralis]|uniref:GNAT family N-acetyltransferase n=1 Tax=Pelagibius litoralis TaxID=374515 RepID=A0A967C2M3_9PROT|nr:GNAT family N-acetyltransferase [Pelagibius litoralis]NIA68483.1 GNAT family N-acetyltransferase [Pelagibius litoralis]
MKRDVPHIRVAKRDDIAAIEAMHLLSVQKLVSRDYSPDQIDAFVSHLGTYDPSLINDGTYFVIEQEGAVIASGGWSWRLPQFEAAGAGKGDGGKGEGGFGLSPDSAKIRSIFVHPQHTRRGLASRLVRLSEEQAAVAGCCLLELWATLTGVPLYLSLGYEEVGRVALEAPDVAPLVSVHMAKPLSVDAPEISAA